MSKKSKIILITIAVLLVIAILNKNIVLSFSIKWPCSVKNRNGGIGDNLKTKNLNNLNFENLVIKDNANIEIVQTDICFVEYDKNLNYKIEIKDNTLYIENLDINHKYKNLLFRVVIPRNVVKNIFVGNKGGDIKIRGYKMNNIVVENMVGDINVNIDNVDKISINSHTGNVNFKGISSFLKIIGGVSNIKCEINEANDDYKISVDNSIGNRNLENKLTGNKLIDIKSTIGDIYIVFNPYKL